MHLEAGEGSLVRRGCVDTNGNGEAHLERACTHVVIAVAHGRVQGVSVRPATVIKLSGESEWMGAVKGWQRGFDH